MLFLNRQNLSLIADSETLLKIYVMYIISQNKLSYRDGFFENCIDSVGCIWQSVSVFREHL